MFLPILSFPFSNGISIGLALVAEAVIQPVVAAQLPFDLVLLVILLEELLLAIKGWSSRRSAFWLLPLDRGTPISQIELGGQWPALTTSQWLHSFESAYL